METIEGLSVTLDKHGRLVVTADGRTRELISIGEIKVDIAQLMRQQLGIYVIRVRPYEIGALTGEENPLFVDTGLLVGDELPDDFRVWNEAWKLSEINSKYIKRVWWDDRYALRFWLETLVYNGSVTFDLAYDEARDKADDAES